MRLIAERLACIRGGRALYDGMSFSLEPGEALLVVGPNGAGKSSLLRQVAGLLPLDGGTLTLEGGELQDHIHYLGHAGAVREALTVSENLEFWRDLYGGGGKLTPETALHRLHLLPLQDLPARNLSAGQKRRLAIARLLTIRRPLWLLDEPDAALDTEGRAVLTGIITEHRAGGGMAMIASHGTLDVAPSREISFARAAQAVVEKEIA
ncbi:MAG: heme ABC exporter ATP-binding protein CcmA [Xanthobacteraceae bacterium]|nr:heme ABC exporter ATP-binding protein CcmA [Xanthobacteraceae bacterium]QYK44912.1 MAG: heme ABC exporter ATP-binding protein CcmA [Xanthobacteraceae bacterium]